MSRFVLRRGRILPGPLKPLALEAPSGSGLMIAPLAATAAAVAATFLVLPQVASKPTAATRTAAMRTAVPGTALAAARTDSVAQVTSPVDQPPSPSRAEIAPMPDRVAAVPAGPKPSSLAELPASGRPSAVKAASAGPTAAVAAHPSSLFSLDILPVLQTGDGVPGLDAAPGADPAPARVTRSVSRKTTRSGTARAEPAQP